MECQPLPADAVVVVRADDFVIVATPCACGDQDHGFYATVDRRQFYSSH